MRVVTFNIMNDIIGKPVRYNGEVAGKVISTDSDGHCKVMVDDGVVHALRDNKSFSLEVVSNEKVW